MALWTTKYINDLPDSSFAYIESGGTKDAEGKTTPRSLRHLPYKDNDGDDDHDHIANALARLNQTEGIPASEKPRIRTMLEKALANTKEGKTQADRVDGSLFRVSPIKLDANGDLPSRIMLMQSGHWPNSIKGDFSISVDDLKEIKDNFDKGVGFPTDDASTGLAIDFKHEYADEAAGWIKGLELSIDPVTGEGKLYANPIEWTDAGEAAIRGGRFKCVSPSGYFGKKGARMSAWPNPTNMMERVKNVLDGAGLTNIPFLRGMSPIRASATQEDELELEYDKVIFSSESQQQIKEKRMSIDEIVVKERESLSVPELDLLIEHKDELSADVLKKFKIEEPAQKETLSAEDAKTLADIREGRVQVVAADKTVVDKDTLDSLQSTAEQYRTEKAESIVDGHIKRGAIKFDSRESWVKMLLAATGDARKALEDQLAGLPSHEQLDKKLGSDQEVDNDVQDELKKKTLSVQKEAKENGEMLSYAQAQDRVLREDPKMKAAVEAAREGK